ncbi:MAG: DUF6350 family protein [Nocardioides sp.]|nr:DUF6350 family protein [Nocardioides sp.]
MTDLIARARGAATSGPDRTESGRPLALTAPLAGLAAGLVPLLVTSVVALTGWFAADAGAHGSTRDALRVGADAWLLGLGARLDLGGAAVGVVPFALTALAAWAAYRSGRWVGRSGGVTDDRQLALAVGLLALTHAALAVLVGVLASVGTARPHLGGAFLGALVLGVLAGGAGVVIGAARTADLLARVPGRVRTTADDVLRVAGLALLLLTAVSAVLLAGLYVAEFGTTANLVGALDLAPADVVALGLVGVLLVPNLLLLAASYLLGPGFAVGTGTIVSPSALDLGTVPALPFLSVLPETDPGSWTTALVALPPLCAAAAVLLLHRARPTTSWEAALVRGLGGGAAAGVALAVLAALGSGALGPGTMAVVGPAAGPVLLAGVVALGLGGGAAALLATWWRRRGGAPEAR